MSVSVTSAAKNAMFVLVFKLKDVSCDLVEEIWHQLCYKNISDSKSLRTVEGEWIGFVPDWAMATVAFRFRMRLASLNARARDAEPAGPTAPAS